MITVRPAQHADREAMLSIWTAASRLAHAFLGEETLRAQRRIVRDRYLAAADNWVAEEDGRLLGFIGLLDGHVGGLFVDPSVQGRGAGRLLVKHAAGRLGALTVDVYELNSGAAAFYRRCGFAPVDRRDCDDEGRPFALLHMRRLPPR